MYTLRGEEKVFAGEAQSIDEKTCAYYRDNGEHQIKCSDCGAALGRWKDGKLMFHEGCGDCTYCGVCKGTLTQDGFIDHDEIDIPN